MNEPMSYTVQAGRSRPAPPRAPLFVAIGAWLVAGIGRAVTAAADSSGPASEQAGAFVGHLIGTVFIVFVVRSIIRLARRRPVLSPAWTPSLFVTAAVLSLLTIAGSAGQGSA